jgi:ABC-type transporter Mla MlaB component
MTLDVSSTVECGDNLTIAQAQSLCAAITKALSANAAVKIECSEATEVDLTFIQLLVSAQRSAEAQHKHLEIAAPVGGALAIVLERLGISLVDLSHSAPASLH